MDKITRIFKTKDMNEIIALHAKTGATIYWLKEETDPETGEIIHVYEWMDGKSLEEIEAEEQKQEENQFRTLNS